MNIINSIIENLFILFLKSAFQIILFQKIFKQASKLITPHEYL